MCSIMYVAKNNTITLPLSSKDCEKQRDGWRLPQTAIFFLLKSDALSPQANLPRQHPVQVRNRIPPSSVALATPQNPIYTVKMKFALFPSPVSDVSGGGGGGKQNGGEVNKMEIWDFWVNVRHNGEHEQCFFVHFRHS